MISRAPPLECCGLPSRRSRFGKSMGYLISLDLFATADNTPVQLFFARYPEPLAEGANALAQLDWGQSRCPHCGCFHRECTYDPTEGPAGGVRG